MHAGNRLMAKLTVKQLIERLQSENPDAEVSLGSSGIEGESVYLDVDNRNVLEYDYGIDETLRIIPATVKGEAIHHHHLTRNSEGYWVCEICENGIVILDD